MFQRGPGEGYGTEAKSEALAIEPGLQCFNASREVGQSYFVVLRGGSLGVGKRVGAGGRTAIDAWRSALNALPKSTKG
jgi:hypothetical protein